MESTCITALREAHECLHGLPMSPYSGDRVNHQGSRECYTVIKCLEIFCIV